MIVKLEKVKRKVEVDKIAPKLIQKNLKKNQQQTIILTQLNFVEQRP